MKPQKTKVTLAILLSNLLISFMGISLVIPVLPTIMSEMSLDGSVVGYMVASFAIAQLIVSPFAGKWTDIFGRKIILVIGLFIYTLSQLLFGLGQTIIILFISRILGGISSAFIIPSVTAFIVDVTPLSSRSKALGYMSAAINTSFIIGPGIGGLLAGFGTRAPFFGAAILACIAIVISIVLLKEPEREQTKGIFDNIPKTRFQHIFVPMFFIAFVLIFISSFGLASFESLFSLFVHHKFHFTPTDIALIVAGGGIIGAMVQILLFEPLTKKIGEVKLVVFCFILSAFLVLMMTLVNSYTLVVLTSCIVFVGFDLIRPAITTYLSKIALNDQGFVGGMNSMFTSLGNIFGPIVGGILFDINLNYPYYFSTIVLIIGIVISLFWKKPQILNS